MLIEARPILAGGQEAATKETTILLIIDYGDGVEKHFPMLLWKPDLTVLDVLKLGKDRPHGITYEQTGTGDTAFITKIDDLKNEGARGGKRNWTFTINDKLIDRGAGACKAKAGDTIRWAYSTRKM